MEHLCTTNIIIFIFAATCQASVNLEQCDQATVNHCIKDLAELGAEVNVAVVPTLEEGIAREHCRWVCLIIYLHYLHQKR